jgi:hypothetical protein
MQYVAMKTSIVFRIVVHDEQPGVHCWIRYSLSIWLGQQRESAFESELRHGSNRPFQAASVPKEKQ